MGACTEGERTPPPQTPPVEGIELWVDGALATTVDSVHVDERRVLTELLPSPSGSLATWTLLAGRSDKGGSLSVPEPGTRFDRHTVELYRVDAGTVGLGVFRVPPAGLPPAQRATYTQPAVFVVPIHRVDVWTVPPPDPPTPSEDLATVVLANGEERTLTRALLGATERVPKRTVPDVLPKNLHNRDAKRRASAGWSVATVLAELGVSPGERGVVVHGKNGSQMLSSLVMSASEPRALFMLNQKGVLMLQPTLRAPHDWNRIKGVTRVEVLGAETR